MRKSIRTHTWGYASLATSLLTIGHFTVPQSIQSRSNLAEYFQAHHPSRPNQPRSFTSDRKHPSTSNSLAFGLGLGFRVGWYIRNSLYKTNWEYALGTPNGAYANFLSCWCMFRESCRPHKTSVSNNSKCNTLKYTLDNTVRAYNVRRTVNKLKTNRKMVATN